MRYVCVCVRACVRACVGVYIGAVRSGLQARWPGVSGRLLRAVAWLLFRDARQGAQSVVYCAVLSDRPLVVHLAGKLVADCRPIDLDLRHRCSYRDADRLWAAAGRLCAHRLHHCDDDDDTPGDTLTTDHAPAAAAAAVTTHDA